MAAYPLLGTRRFDAAEDYRQLGRTHADLRRIGTEECVEVARQVPPDKVLGGARLTLLTNVSVTLKVALKNGQVVSLNYPERIATIPAGESKLLKDLLKDVNTAQVVRAFMVLSCDQNRRQ